MAGMLKTLNPEHYEENRDILGEVSDWEEIEEPFTLKDIDEVEMDGEPFGNANVLSCKWLMLV